MKKILAFFGKSGCGKDTILKKHYDEQGQGYEGLPPLNIITLYTTRPQRENEINGKDYFFVSHKEMLNLIENGNIIHASFFNNWCYGISISSLKDNYINIGIFNIETIEELLKIAELDILPVYVTASNKNILLRCLNREQNPDCHEICRRFLADEEDFLSIPFEYITLPNDAPLPNYMNIFNREDIKNWVKKEK